MLAQLSVGALFEHPSAAGHAAEHHWLQLFDRYLPKRYRAAPAFEIDSAGRRSRQIDIAIFDNLYTPPLFPHSSGLHLPDAPGPLSAMQTSLWHRLQPVYQPVIRNVSVRIIFEGLSIDLVPARGNRSATFVPADSSTKYSRSKSGAAATPSAFRHS